MMFVAVFYCPGQPLKKHSLGCCFSIDDKPGSVVPLHFRLFALVRLCVDVDTEEGTIRWVAVFDDCPSSNKTSIDASICQ
jgi:hypothetical protein